MITLILFIYGLAIGSFLNVLIDRLSMEQPITGRSHCDHCKKTLKWIDLIPVFSYLALRGKCRYCGKKLSPQYPLVELATGIVFVVAWMYSPWGAPALRVASLVVAGALLVILVADIKYHIIPDEMHIVLIAAGVYITLIRGNFRTDIPVQVISGIAIMLPILILYLITRGRGMGFGDVKLAFVIGFLLGIFRGILALYIAFLSGAIIGVFLLLMSKKGMKSRIAFGPFLVLGIVLLFYFDKQVFLLVDKFFHSR